VLLSGVEQMLRRLIDEDIVLAINSETPVDSVRADPGQLEQVLVNLVLNARDAMPLGGEISIGTAMTELDARAGVEVGLPPGRYLVVTVSDNGSGMTEETKARIFEPFFTTKEQGKGTGLGLATVYGIVEQFGGKISLDTQLGVGSTFFVYLPTIGAGDSDVEAEEEQGATRVLVVEDEDQVRDLVTLILEEEGYRVLEAANGRQALEFLERHPGAIDLILTDVVMPDVNGPELVARLESLRTSARVLFMSGYADSQLVSRGVHGKGVKILHKPFTATQLATQVAALLGDEREAG
jgi:two-component system cell cycle sensor histidine kinase/response regulator CckA